MSCENPINIRNPRYRNMGDEVYWRVHYRILHGITLPDEFLQIPCGKCLACKKARAKGWQLRLMSEFERYPNSYFITLTFEDRYLEEFKDNVNRSIHLFLDRLRKVYKNKSIRHFICGEYGKKTKRFHYHGILFNLPDKFNLDILEKTWKYGFVYLGWCTQDSIEYVTKYITKTDEELEDKYKVPRLIVSKGIGEYMVESYKDSPLKHQLKPLIISDKGYKIPLPRYVKSKLYSYDELELIAVERFKQPFKAYLDGKEYTNRYEYNTALKRKYLKNLSLGLSSPYIKKRYTEIQPLKLSDWLGSPFDTDNLANDEFVKSSFDIQTTPF